MWARDQRTHSARVRGPLTCAVSFGPPRRDGVRILRDELMRTDLDGALPFKSPSAFTSVYTWAGSGQYRLERSSLTACPPPGDLPDYLSPRRQVQPLRAGPAVTQSARLPKLPQSPRTTRAMAITPPVTPPVRPGRLRGEGHRWSESTRWGEIQGW